MWQKCEVSTFRLTRSDMCLVSFPGRSHSAACPARLNQQTPIEERESRVILAASSHPLKTNTKRRERSIFLVFGHLIWYVVVFWMEISFVISSGAVQCKGGTKDKSFLLPKNFSLHCGEEQGHRTRSSGAIFYLGKCQLQTFPSPLKVGSLVTLWLQLLSPRSLNFNSSCCISTFTCFLHLNPDWN